MRFALVLSLLAAAGCATTQRGPNVVEGNANTVVVSWYESNVGRKGALEVADAHCAKFGKSAQYAANSGDFSAAYNCVKP